MFFQQLINRLTTGSVYALTALKLVEPGSLNREAETSPRVIDRRQ
jgi:hypothetical protein